GDATLTSITAWRRSDSFARQDPDFSSADIIYPFTTNVKAETFTQELRLNVEIGDRINALFGAFYLNDKIDQTGELKYSSQMRDYVNFQVLDATSGALNLTALEQTFGALDGDPTQYLGRFFA